MDDTILSRVVKWSTELSEKPLFTFLGQDLNVTESLTFSDLYKTASSIASNLENSDLSGKRVAIFLKPGLDFVKVFIGCLLAKVVPIPLPPPKGARQVERTLPTLQDCKASAIITNSSELKLDKKKVEYPVLCLNQFDMSVPFSDKKVAPSDVAFIQYTSGSISSPKGCVVKHKHLFHNQLRISEAFSHSRDSIVVGWLPVYHDMGLIGNILHPIFFGVSAYLMSPLTFMANPLNWLKAISLYKGTTSGGPNFAYDLCYQKILDDKLQDIDLSSWEIAFSGSEMVNPSTLERFNEKFAKCGFKKNAFYPCYGLAEATLFVSSNEKKSGYKIDKHKMDNGIKNRFVSCGKTWGDDQVLIVDPKRKKVVPENQIGEIWVQSKSIVEGYWNNPELTNEKFKCKVDSFRGHFLNTGDLGYIKEGNIFLVGRKKNVIIIRGKNYYSTDIERIASEASGFIGLESNAAFSVAVNREEKLVIAQEVPRIFKKTEDLQQIALNVQRKIASEIGVKSYDVVLVTSNSLPKTTSGKVRHYVVKDQYLHSKLKLRFSLKEENEKKEQSLESAFSNAFPSSFIDCLTSIKGMSWEGVLENTRIIDLGLDSLLAGELAYQIAHMFNVEISIDEILGGTSIKELWHLIEKRSSKIKINTKKLPYVNFSNFDLSPYQQSLFIHSEIYPKSSAYNIVGRVDIKGEFSFKRFKETVKLLIELHPMLSVSLKRRDNKVCQSINSKINPIIWYHDLSKCNEEEKIQRIKEIQLSEVNRVWNLYSPPLFNFSIISLSDSHYILYANFHHLICDGFSLNVLLRDMVSFYKTLKKGILPKDVRKLSTPYQNFVKNTNEKLKSHLGDNSLKYWIEIFLQKRFPSLEISNLQNDKYFPIGILEFRTYGTHSNFHMIAKRSGSTLAAVVLTIFHVALSYYSGNEFVSIGYPSANRPKEFNRTVGLFVSSLVSCSNIGPHTTFRELLEKVKKGLWNGEKHSFIPLDLIQEELSKKKQDSSRHLFNAFFVMQNFDFKDITTSDFKMSNFRSFEVEPMYDFICEVQNPRSNLEIKFQFNSGKVSKKSAVSFISTFESIAETASSNLDFILNSRSLFSPEEQSKILAFEKGISSIQTSYHSKNPSILEEFKCSVKKNKSRLAIISDQWNLTYDELDALSDQIAVTLLKKGVQKGDSVGILLPRSPYQCASILGIFKAGALYIPLDIRVPPKRLRRISKQVELRAVIAFLDNLPELAPSFPLIIEPHRCSKEKHNKLFFPSEEDLAYTIFTSGSTGEPKGVQVSHGALSNFVKEAKHFFALKNVDRVLQFSSINWDTYSEEVFPTLLTGGAIVLRSESVVEPFDILLERTRTFQITHWNLPSSYFEELMDEIDTFKQTVPDSLRMVIIGGEKISKKAIEKWFQNFSKEIALLNTYGATEITSISTTLKLSKEDLLYASAPIGKPIGGVVASIRNSYGNRVPIGVEGELVIGGKGLSQGYVRSKNNPEKTDKFVHFPDSSEKYYRTGDRAFWTSNGKIILKGRSDRMVKRRGIRIYLEEIESAISRIGGVKNCLVVLESGIVAFVLPLSNALLKDELKTFQKKIQLELPDYMVPDQVIPLESFPRLPNGKIDYQSLKKIAKKRALNSKCHLKQNKTESEKIICKIWESVLGHSDFSLDDNFFDAGGNSLLLTKLHSILQKKLNYKLDISTLFSHGTCHHQALLIDKTYQECEQTTSVSSKNDLLQMLEKLYAGDVNLEEAKQALELGEEE